MRYGRIAVAAFLSFALTGSGLVSCGDSGTEPEEGEGQTYIAGGSVGDLILYTVDQIALTYSYEVLESEFGLTGVTGSGTLTVNPDGSYTTSPDQARVVLLPNTLVVGMAEVAAGGGTTDMYFAGVPQLETTYDPAQVAGTYNMIGFECFDPLSGGACTAGYRAGYGTFRVDAGGTFEHCTEGDINDTGNHPCREHGGGTWVDQGNGIVQASAGGMVQASVTLLPSPSGGKVLIVDVKNRPGQAGPGLIVGVKRQDVSGVDLTGSYNYIETNGRYGTATIPDPDTPGDPNSAELLETDQLGNQMTLSGTMTRNSPWTGWMETNEGSYILILPGDGVMFFFDPADNTWIGLGGM
ncbi:MAG: hypothetical protein GTN78_13045 [Gemmatimonadales bacterium]|nr:hypothetical protein [Gemmatimonadales bacterium]NIN13552.1 hypothetical protein [Gemmatimonadales bacterium]NIR01103.1 hypothetical protein [Gemmatimonadales bacterium]